MFNGAKNEIERLRKHRARPGREMSTATTISAIAGDTTRTHKKLGQLIELWEQLVPADLASQTSITSLRGGIAQVQVNSAAAGFEIDRLLRSRLLVQLRGGFAGTLHRVKVKVGG